MLGLIRSDFYKLIKMKSFLICLLSLAALGVSTIAINHYYYTSQLANGASMAPPTVYNYLLDSFSNPTTIFIAVLASLMAACEFGFGTIKNSASRGFSRENVYLSKQLTASVAALACVAVFMAATVLSGTVLWGFGAVPAGYWGGFLTAFLLEILLTLALTSVFVFVAFFVRQSGGAIALNLCIMQFAMLGAMLAEMAVDKLFGWKIKFSELLLSFNMQAVASGVTQETILRALIVGISFLIVFTGSGLLIFHKRDIK